MPNQNPVIVIPGITATELYDDYPIVREGVWGMIFNKQIDRLALHPSDMRYEALEPAHILTGQIFGIYDSLVNALRHDLSIQADKPTPVFTFPYDWRMDIQQTAEKLADFIQQVLNRTRLLKHYQPADNLKVDLVGHSLGGLIICEYLGKAGSAAPVGKVVTLGTPFQGSNEAIAKLATGTSPLAGPEPEAREREAARATPSIYQILPSYPDAVVDEHKAEIDVYTAQNIQDTIIDTLKEYVRIFTVTTDESQQREQATQILNTLLKNGSEHRQRIMQFKLSSTPLQPSDWLAIVGIGKKTRVQVQVKRVQNKLRFVLSDAQLVSKTTVGRNALKTGDGTVCLASALPPFLEKENVVCVTSDDFSFWELGDKLLNQFGSFHAVLPTVNLVQRLVIKHLRKDFGGPVWGTPVPGVILKKWDAPIANLSNINQA